MWLSESETETFLHRVAEMYRAQANDTLLTALALAFAAWTGNGVLVDLEGPRTGGFVSGLRPDSGPSVGLQPSVPSGSGWSVELMLP